MVDADRVNDLLVAAEAYLADVRAFADEIDRATFVADRGEQYRIAFPLQQAIQLAIDLAAHLLAEQPGHRPDTLVGLFIALGEGGIVDDSLAARLAAMARFRDLLVHQYADLDPDRVWDIVHGDLVDVDRFLALVGGPTRLELRLTRVRVPRLGWGVRASSRPVPRGGRRRDRVAAMRQTRP